MASGTIQSIKLFPDYSNGQTVYNQSITSTTNVTAYTATNDCYVLVRIKTSKQTAEGNTAFVFVNGFQVMGKVFTTVSIDDVCGFPLKTGDVITARSDSSTKSFQLTINKFDL